MLSESIAKLVQYGITTGLTPECERNYTTNLLLDVFHEDDYEKPDNIEEPVNLEATLGKLLDEAVKRGLIEDSIVYRDLFDTRLMNCLMPRPGQVQKEFWDKYKESPKEATDYFYKLSQDSNYIRRYRVEKDQKWKVDSTYGEIDITMNILEEMMRKVPKMQIIVNGDDALSAYLAMDSGNPYVTYGISKPVIKSAANEIREGRFCKRCGEKLEYRFYHYSQLGDYYCPKCGFARPKPDFDAEDVKVGDQLSFCVEGKHIVANYKGFYNVYNILAAYAGVRTAGFAGEHFGDMLRRFNPENGRMEQFRIKGTGVTLNLAKNPAGFNQNISAVMQDQAPKDIIIAINDNAQDGTDISWLWDVDFDLLGNDSVKSITVSGIRCQDMRLRLKYVDIPSVLEGDVEKAIRDRVEDGVGNLYVLVNYTALFSTRNILKRLEGEK